jgi:hypothetical protein
MRLERMRLQPPPRRPPNDYGRLSGAPTCPSPGELVRQQWGSPSAYDGLTDAMNLRNLPGFAKFTRTNHRDPHRPYSRPITAYFSQGHRYKPGGWSFK